MPYVKAQRHFKKTGMSTKHFFGVILMSLNIAY